MTEHCTSAARDWWIAPADLVDGSLRDAIRQDAAVVEDQSQSKSKRARALVRVDSDLVASLSSTGRQFKELIDRRALPQSHGAAAADE
jgi:hypothetical protein